MNTSDLSARRERLFGKGAPLFYREPLHIERGEGVWLFDSDGRRYLDMYNNVPCVGHCHPHVVEAMHRQAVTLNVHSRYLHEGVLNYAERLTDLQADSLTSVVFVCSGTEANEVELNIRCLELRPSAGKEPHVSGADGQRAGTEQCPAHRGNDLVQRASNFVVDREPPGALIDIAHLIVILQIGTHTLKIGDHLDTVLAQQSGRADAGELQQLRRVDCPTR